MTTRNLTGTYSAGYTVSPTVTLLKPLASAYVGGVGVVASALVEVDNLGRILGASGAGGASGDTGVDLSAGGTVINFSTIAGGAGASSNGGSAIVLSSVGEVVNHGQVAGGAGGDNTYPGGGGQGGDGMALSAGGTVLNGGDIAGGQGGAARAARISAVKAEPAEMA